MRPDSANGRSRRYKVSISCRTWLSSAERIACWSAAVVTISSRSMMPLRPDATLWISQPFSGKRWVAEIMRSLIELHDMPRPYCLVMDASTQMASPVVACASWWALTLEVQSLMSAHR